MAKFYGMIGFGIEAETSPGVFELVIVERPYYGEVVRETLEASLGNSVLGESKTGNAFSVVADAYAELNFFDMKYVKWNGRYWTIKQVELRNRPRIQIRIGGVWNGPTAPPASDAGSPPGVS